MRKVAPVTGLLLEVIADVFVTHLNAHVKRRLSQIAELVSFVMCQRGLRGVLRDAVRFHGAPSEPMRATIVFSEREGVSNSPGELTFDLFAGTPGLSPARTSALYSLLQFGSPRVSWRVRAVNGSNCGSYWSPMLHGR